MQLLVSARLAAGGRRAAQQPRIAHQHPLQPAAVGAPARRETGSGLASRAVTTSNQGYCSCNRSLARRAGEKGWREGLQCVRQGSNCARAHVSLKCLRSLVARWLHAKLTEMLAFAPWRHGSQWCYRFVPWRHGWLAFAPWRDGPQVEAFSFARGEMAPPEFMFPCVGGVRYREARKWSGVRCPLRGVFFFVQFTRARMQHLLCNCSNRMWRTVMHCTMRCYDIFRSLAR